MASNMVADATLQHQSAWCPDSTVREGGRTCWVSASEATRTSGACWCSVPEAYMQRLAKQSGRLADWVRNMLLRATFECRRLRAG